MPLAPVGIMTYKRLGHLRKTVEALLRNDLANQTHVFFFSDGPKPGDEKAVDAVRKYLSTVQGFGKVEILARESNDWTANGLGNLHHLLEKFGKAIFLEEDVITAPGFLRFINQGLTVYRDRPDIFAVCAYTPDMRLNWLSHEDIYLGRRFSAWGFGIWLDRYIQVPRYIEDYERVKCDKEFIQRLRFEGDDVELMLEREISRSLDAFDVRAMYTMARNDLSIVAPMNSLTENIGHDGTGMHCGNTERFRVDLSRARSIHSMNVDVVENPIVTELLRRFRSEPRSQPWDDSSIVQTIRKVSADILKATGDSCSENTSESRLSDMPLPDMGKNLIFLLGLPRSGTTLLQRILGGHNQIHTVAEPWIMLHMCYALKHQGIETEYDATLARQGLEDFSLEIPGGGNAYIEALRDMAGSLYQKALYGTGKSRFLDKTPRYFLIISELKRIFPRAKFVFLLRNPLAIFASVLRSWFNGDAKEFQASKYHRQDLFDGPSHLVQGIDELGDDAIVLQYEGLVSDPVASIQTLCALLELPYEENMLNYGDQSEFKGRFGDQIGIKHHDSAVTDSIFKWTEDFMDPEAWAMARCYLDHLGTDILGRMGYSHEELSASLDQIATEGLRRGLAVGDQATPQIRAQLSAELCEEGEKHFACGELDAAAGRFLEAARIDSYNPRPYNNIGVMLWNEGEKVQAGEYLAKALLSSPNDRTTVLNYGDMMEALDKSGMARAAYWNYMLAHPEDEEVAQRYIMLPEVHPEGASRSVHSQERLAVTPENFAEFTYSKRSHFDRLLRHESQQHEDIDDCNLKVYQDMLAYNFVLDNFPEGAKLLDVGGGDSRIIRWLKGRYEFWNLDKLEGLGNGLIELDSTSGFRLVRDYIGTFSKALPEGYFDGIFSISTLEHVPEDPQTLLAICQDMDRLLKPGGLSMHCFDVVIKPEMFWIHPLVDFFYAHEPVLNPRIPDWKMRIDPNLWGMTRRGYDRTWLPVTNMAYEKFGKPLSYNVLWRKAD